MKEIPLTQGKVALLHDEDFEWLSGYKWYCSSNGTDDVDKFYAARKNEGNNKPKSIYMHRMILGFPTLDVDHVDGNSLNNQRSNLRTCTRSENMMNQSKEHVDGEFKGVYWRKRTEKWRACIKKDRVQYELGEYDSKLDAALAYNAAAQHLFGEYARLNPI